MKDILNLTIVTRETRLEQLRARWGTLGQAKFLFSNARARQTEQVRSKLSKTANLKFIEQQQQADFDDYQKEDQLYQLVIDQLQRELDFGYPIKILDRAYVTNFDFSRTAIVIVVGQDGLVANVAKYVGNLPIVAINPDPERFDGVLLPFTVADARYIVENVLAGKYQSRNVTLAQVTLGDQQRLLAFNDLFIGTSSHTSARYLITSGEQSEAQSSSGVLISTGAGSTGWLSSVYNMASGVAAFLGHQIPRPEPWSWEERRLGWAVREPFASRRSSANVVVGQINDQEKLIIESMMPEHGVIFSDGIETDFLPFNGGTVASIGIAEQQARLVIPSN